MNGRACFALAIVVVAACDDALDQRLAIIDEPRILAIVAEPAEATPGSVATYRAVVAGPDGPITDPAAWAFCLAPKPPTEDNVVSTRCLGDDAELQDLGAGATVTATLPSDGCIRFGPDTPPGGFRPRDPDGSGGYYQPLRVEISGQIAFGMSRITCNLPTAPADVAREYELGYVANANPTLDPIELGEVPADSDVTLIASWPEAAAERYLWYDPLAQRLVTRREAMRVSWFTTGGGLAVDASAVGETDPTTQVSTTWHTPAAGTAWVWLVLRDSRGGIATREIAVQVR